MAKRKPVAHEKVMRKFGLKIALYEPLGKSVCWNWSPIDVRGYGRICRGNLAHRISWEHYNGPFNKQLFICHKCDNPRCVNPNHLFIGDPKANMDDMRSKGRARYIGSSILTTEQLTDIKSKLKFLPGRRYGRLKFWGTLAKEYNINKVYLRNLATGITRRKMDNAQ